MPQADPYLLPMAGLLTAVGIVEIYRLGENDALRQGIWIVVGVGLFAVTLVLLRRDYRVLENYKYLFGLASIVLLVLPAAPGIGRTVNGARLWVGVGSFQFQPGEFAKLALIVFLAGYLREKREVLAQGRLKDWGPLLVIWGGAMLVLVETNDLGSALLYYGIFLAMLYAATGRGLYVLFGLGLFAAGAYGAYHSIGHVQDRVTIWLHPWTDTAVYCAQTGGTALRQDCGSYQLVKSLYSIGNGGYLGPGFGKGTFTTPGGDQLIPFLNTDFIYSAIAQELGLVGAAALLLVFMLFVARGMRISLHADDGFSKLLAAGLTFGFALQTFIIVGGVLRLIPLTGITLPFVSYGGSSVVANFMLLAGLLLVSNRSSSPADGGGPVNRQIARLGVVALLLIVALIVATTYWQTWASAGLADRQDNSIQRVAQFKIKRGLIYAGDGKTVLAANKKKKVGGQTLYFRTYPTHGLAAHAVGYSTIARSRAGIERAENDYLTASNGNLNSAVRTTLDKLQGVTVKGNNVVLTLNVKAQKVAESLLRGKCGAAVALDPQTGAVLAIASSPSYDPNLIESNFAKAQKAPGSKCGAPLLDRATQGLYPPGSTFKVVTTVAALDTGAFRPDSSFVDPGYCEEYGRRISNAGNPEAPETFGRLTLATALQHSVNSVYCNIGKQLGAGPILDYAERFGFYSKPPLDLPSPERAASGLYKNGSLWKPSKPKTQVDPGRLAFGQERMLVTPMQMAMVAATVAKRRRPDAAAARQADHLAVRLDDLEVPARQAAAGDEAADGGAGDGDDGVGRQRRHRHRGPDLGGQGRRQDGHRRDGAEQRLRPLVRRLRARRPPAGGGGGRGRGRLPWLRRLGVGPDREADHGGDPAGPVNSVPCGLSHVADRHHDRPCLRRPLPHRPQARGRRDGRRLPGRGPGARTPRRDQGPERPARPRRPVRRAVPARGQERGRALAPEHRLDLRPRRGRGLLLHRDGVPRGADAEGADRPQRPDAGADRDRLRAPDPLRRLLRAPERDRPPRHQAAQHRRRARRAPEGDGLRDRALGRLADDGGRLDHRHRAVPLAGAGARRRRRPALGHLLGRRRPLRDADRRGAVLRRHAGRDRDEAPLDGALAALGAERVGPARARLDRPAGAREGARPALPERRRDGRRPRPGRARASPSPRRPRRRRRWCSRAPGSRRRRR